MIGPWLVSGLAALAVCATFAALGARLRQVARLPLVPALKLPVDFLLGAWAVAGLALAIGLLGWFRPAVLLTTVVVGAALGRWRGAGWQVASAWPLTPPAAVFLPVALAAPFFYDAHVYHLGLPWQALQDGRIAGHSESLFASFPPGAQMIYAPALAAGLVRVPALLHLASFLAAAMIVVSLARSLGAQHRVALLAGWAFLLLPSLALVPGLPAADGWAAATTLAGVSASLRARWRQTDAWWCGLLAGIATSARLQGLPWMLILLGIVMIRSSPKARAFGIASASFVAASWPWWLKNLMLFGEPALPMGRRDAGMEIAWRDSGSNLYLMDGPADWLPTLTATLAPHLSYLAPLALAGLVTLVTLRSKPARLLALACVLGGGAWFLTGSLPRYLATSLGCLLALAAAASATPRIGRVVATLALATSLVLGTAFTVQQMMRWGGVRLMLAQPGDWPAGLVTHDPSATFAAAQDLPIDSRVLFVGEARGFGFPRRFVAPSPYDPSPLTGTLESSGDVDDTVAWLRSEGYTHVLINLSELNRLAPSHPVEPWTTSTGRQRFGQLLERLSPAVAIHDDVALFTVSDRMPRSGS